MNQCKICKKTGRVGCGYCGGDGKVSCETCSGSGHELAWLTFDETSRWLVRVTDSPIVAAHPILREPRELELGELDEFTVNERIRNDGALASGRPFIDAENSKVASRLERVAAQQYLELAVVRRDVAFRMCGAQGTLVLSGNNLTPATTGEALAPIKRRNRFLGLLTLALLGAAVGVWSAIAGRTDYFLRTNVFAAVAIGVAGLLAIPSIAGLLRSWGAPGEKTSLAEKLLGAASAGALAAAFIITVVERPTTAEVDRALAVGDVDGAYHVLSALHDLEGDAPSVKAVEDRVLLEDAKRSKGDRRLALLDTVAGRSGDAAATAAATAKAERLAQVRAAIAAKRPEEAFTAIERWFPRSTDGEVREELAKAHEIMIATCADLACKFEHAERAATAKASPIRTSNAADARKTLTDALATPTTPETDVLARAQKATALSTLAARAAALKVSTPEIAASARAATDWAEADRIKIPLLGSTLPVADALLEGAFKVNDKIGLAHLQGGVDAYFALDAGGRIRGVYAVGSAASMRIFSSSVWTPNRILSQSVGRSTAMNGAPKNQTSMRWNENGIPVQARFDEGNLVELRIGNAAP